MSQMQRELVAAGVPAMAGRPGGRVPLGFPFKAVTGQWAIEADGTALWHGPPPAAMPPPGPALLAKVAAVRAAHVPEPPKPPPPDLRLVLRALVRNQRGLVLTNGERDALDAAAG